MENPTTFIVVRHGSNAANQSLTPRAVVGLVRAESINEAEAFAASAWHCYNNQHLELVAWREARHADRSDARDLPVHDAAVEAAELLELHS